MKLPQGFVASATAAGLKSSGAKDLTLIVNVGPSQWASAVFTSNQVIAAPVFWSKEDLAGIQKTPYGFLFTCLSNLSQNLFMLCEIISAR